MGDAAAVRCGDSAGRQDQPDLNGLPAHISYGDRPAPPSEVWTFGVYGNQELVSIRIDREASRKRLDWKFTEEPAFVREPLDTLVTELAGNHLVILTNRDAHTGVELPFTLAAPPPLQQEPGRRRTFVALYAPDSRQQSETASPVGERRFHIGLSGT